MTRLGGGYEPWGFLLRAAHMGYAGHLLRPSHGLVRAWGFPFVEGVGVGCSQACVRARVVLGQPCRWTGGLGMGW